MNERWLAISTTVVGVFLLIVGAVAVYGINGTNTVVLDPLSPFGTAEYVDSVRSMLPVLYLLAIEGMGLGAVALSRPLAYLPAENGRVEHSWGAAWFSPSCPWQ